MALNELYAMFAYTLVFRLLELRILRLPADLATDPGAIICVSWLVLACPSEIFG